jgi:hypothetical protein
MPRWACVKLHQGGRGRGSGQSGGHCTSALFADIFGPVTHVRMQAALVVMFKNRQGRLLSYNYSKEISTVDCQPHR